MKFLVFVDSYKKMKFVLIKYFRDKFQWSPKQLIFKLVYYVGLMFSPYTLNYLMPPFFSSSTSFTYLPKSFHSFICHHSWYLVSAQLIFKLLQLFFSLLGVLSLSPKWNEAGNDNYNYPEKNIENKIKWLLIVVFIINHH